MKRSVFVIAGMACGIVSAHASDSVPMVVDRADQPFLQPIAAPELPPGVELFFSPTDDIESVVLRELRSKQAHEILFSQYAITNPKIVEALLQAHARGVVIIGVLEPRPAITGYTAHRQLAAAGIPLLFSAIAGWNNNKFVVIDRAKVITGSFDWTRSAPNNMENVLVITEASIAARYYNAWLCSARLSRTYAATFSEQPPMATTGSPNSK